MDMRNMLQLSTVALALAGGTGLVAQVTTGSLYGHISDINGQPVAGARVSLESPALFQTRVLKTDAKGEYRAQLLPVGNYTIKVSATGLLGKTAEGVRVGVGAALSFDFALKPLKETAGATVEVTANSVQEAKTDDKVSINYSAEELLRLPTDRSFDGALAISPGVTGTGLSTSIRGGSLGGQTKAGTPGQGISQVLYRIDGIDVKDDSGTQWDAPSKATLYEPLPDSIEDVQVVLSALNARNGRTEGGQVNVVTKSGSNEYSGTIRTYISRPSWTTNLSKGPVPGSDISAYESNAVQAYSRYTDITLSGPIIKDRLWFYVGTRLQPSQSGTSTLGWLGEVVDHPELTVPGVMKYPLTTYGKYPNVDQALMHGAPAGYTDNNLTNSQFGDTVPADTKYEKYEGKLTGMLTPDHTVYFTYLHDKTVQGGMTGERGIPITTVNTAFVGDLPTTTNAYTLGWNGALAKDWFIEARAFHTEVKIGDVSGPTTHPIFVQSFASTGVDASGNPLYLIRETDGMGMANPSSNLAAFYGPTQVLRSSSDITPNIRGNDSVNANVKTIQEAAGQHEIDFGGEYYQSKHQFGRERSGGYGIFVGGNVYNPTTGTYLFPTYYSSDGSDLTDQTDGTHVQFSEMPMRGPGAHMEHYWAGQAAARNNSLSYWVNDIWSINDQWNVMAGMRFNKFLIKDTNQKDVANVKVWEPRLQVKFNPDGKNQEIYTFTAAKLASAYSDEMAAWFRTNGWTTRTVLSWKGLPGQPAVDSMAGGNPAGVAWVDYNALIDPKNYKADAIIDLSQTSKTDTLQVPYAVELTLGYTRNFDTGSARINYVHRTYKKEWLVFIHNGYYDPADPTKYMTLVHDPGGSSLMQWQQTHNFMNSDLSQVYQGIELSWNEAITPRLSFGGNYSYSQQTGQNAQDYYQYRDEKLLQGVPESVWAPSGTLSRSQVANLFLTYVYPIGKGNISASVLANYATAAVRSLNGVSNLVLRGTVPDTLNGVSTAPIDWIAGQNENLTYNNYYGGLGNFKGGNDSYHVDLKLQAQFPLMGKVVFTTYVQVYNVFNRILQTTTYDWGTPGEIGYGGDYNNNAPINGRPIGTFANPWGYANDSTYNLSGRTFTQFSAGLKF